MEKLRALFFSFLFLSLIHSGACAEEKIHWQPWSPDLFAQAKKENKFVLLDLEAVWCHWCHEMDQTTYSDPKVIELIGQKFIPVRVDQESSPDLALRYEDWGWPATVVFSPTGSEIVKRRGYLEPVAMASMLQAIVDDPTPGPSVAPEPKWIPSEKPSLTTDQKRTLEEEHFGIFDYEFGGWGSVYKLIDPDNMEYAIEKAQGGNKDEEKMARQTLDAALHLEDHEWGGFFQYSDAANWKSPHYEKIASIQAINMRLYAFAYALWGEPRYLAASKKIAQYLQNFWTSPEGAFYLSQDADIDSVRRGQSFYRLSKEDRKIAGVMPKVDRHIYSRENGWLIRSLCELYGATAERQYLEMATAAAYWILEHRSLEGGGFRHDETDSRGPFLGDTLSMGQAFFSLYTATADPKWLARSEEAVLFVEKNFKTNDLGFCSSKFPESGEGVFLKPVVKVDENLALLRWTIRLYHTTGREPFKEMALHAMRFLASPALVGQRRFLTGILTADQELAVEPLRITVVGPKSNLTARKLYLEALKAPLFYKILEWREFDADFKSPALFTCQNKTCGRPISDPKQVQKALKLKK